MCVTKRGQGGRKILLLGRLRTGVPDGARYKSRDQEGQYIYDLKEAEGVNERKKVKLLRTPQRNTGRQLGGHWTFHMLAPRRWQLRPERPRCAGGSSRTGDAGRLPLPATRHRPAASEHAAFQVIRPREQRCDAAHWAASSGDGGRTGKVPRLLCGRHVTSADAG